MDWSPIYLSLKLATCTSLLLLIICVPIALKMSKSTSRWKFFFESIFNLPILLPPTVIGFYLLLAFSPNTYLGTLFEKLNLQLPFTFSGILLASILYSFPFMMQPLQKSLEMIPRHIWDISYSLGKSKWTTIYKVILPNIRNAILSAVALTFAHTMGEFGVILMIGGNIPGETNVASIAIYSEIEAMNYKQANAYALVLIAISLMIIIFIQLLNRRKIRQDSF